MKAAILAEYKRPLIIDDITLPKLTFGQVLIRICYAPLDESLIAEIDKKNNPNIPIPYLLGYEASGIVEEIGPYVTKVKPGDHVILHLPKGCGFMAPQPEFRWEHSKLNSGIISAFQEKTIISENHLLQIPNDFSLESASLYGCTAVTGFGAVAHDARVNIGQSVIIFGAGTTGLCAALGAKLASAYPIIVVDIFDNKLEMARQFGATHVINSTKPGYYDEILNLTGINGADISIETTGSSRVIETSYQITASWGTTLLVGVPPIDATTTFDTLPLHYNKKIIGFSKECVNPDRNIPDYIRAQSAGLFDLQPLITGRFDLDHINDAIEIVRSGKAGCCLIRI
jgi:Zn-dependent alcohol dehydrogenase